MKRLVLILFVLTGTFVMLCGNRSVVHKEYNVSFSYDLSKMTIILDGKEVPYYVVYDSVSGNIRPDFVKNGGSGNKKKSIKECGEKYREGILIFKTRNRDENVRNK